MHVFDQHHTQKMRVRQRHDGQHRYAPSSRYCWATGLCMALLHLACQLGCSSCQTCYTALVHPCRQGGRASSRTSSVPAHAAAATAHDGSVTAVLPTPDGMYWLSAGTDSRVHLWDTLYHR